MDDIAARLGHLTDKFSLGYYPHYKRLAGQIGPSGHVLEVGVERGGSLMMWRELFPDGLVAGADNDSYGLTVFPPGTVQITADQDSPELPVRAREASPEGYDLIVDDASHLGHLSQATFTLLWPLVKPGRWYVLEDWVLGYMPGQVNYLGQPFGDSILRFAQSLLTLIGSGPGTSPFANPGDIDLIEYRFGQAFIHKRAA